ncbi:putative ribonuclease H-like domain-containing protein [Tanacetum coccineum]|uniref:Ribonuclease H-like domain-containing protein n=1 Tax=Tanacetum coccineum TaxID=301880 RepID=A0ABQ4Y2V7_9ASTR
MSAMLSTDGTSRLRYVFSGHYHKESSDVFRSVLYESVDCVFTKAESNSGNKVLKRKIGEVEQEYKPTTAEEKQDKRNEMKAIGTLLMALPNKDQLKFHSYKDAKLLMEAIEKRYGGNKESKKVQRSLLKQQYENFSGSSSETMDQTFDRLQKLISQLEIQGETISQEDMNLKLLRSLPSEWKTHALIWRNKVEIETISLDNLYNNLKIYEHELKDSTNTSQNPQNVAFVSFNSTNSNSSTNEADKTAYGVSTAHTQSSPTSGDNLSDAVICAFLASQPNSPQMLREDLEQIDPDDLEEMDLQWEMAMLTIRARRFIKRIGRQLDANGKRVRFDRTKVECYNCHKYAHFAGECRLPRNQEKREKENNRRTVTVETPNENTLVAQDGIRGYDWSYQVEEEHPTNFALMARTSLGSSSSSDYEVDSCSKSCVKAYATLKEQYDNLNSDYNKSQFNLVSYKAGLESVEARLAHYKKNEAVFEESINVLKLDVRLRDNALVENKKKLEKAEKERDELKLTLEKFQNSSKSLNNLLESQVSDKFKTGLGYNAVTAASPAVTSFVNSSKMLKNQEYNRSKGYHAVPPPYTGNFISRKPDLTFIDEIVEIESNVVRMNNSSAPIIEDCNYDDESEIDYTVRPSIKNIRFVKPARETVEKHAGFGNPIIIVHQLHSRNILTLIHEADPRHMTGNKRYLDEYEDYDGGFVSFGDGKGRISRKGLPSKIFENDHSCVACQKGKQHKASYKTKLVNSISKPLHMLHMDLFGPTNVKSLMKKSYCLVVTDDFSRFSWVFFLATKDETSGILKTFITEIENQLDHKVKVIRCDNGTEFKNSVMNQFCEMKGIKREFGVARTPQQNGVVERKNRTLIEAARTMCPVTILNTRDHLGKFDGKADEGYFVGYSVVSKDMRVFNKRTMIVEETLNIRFLENTPNVKGNGPDWLFDVDSLTISMNYVPVVARNQTNGIAGTKDNIIAGHAQKEKEHEQEYILIPLCTTDPLISQGPKDSEGDARMKPTEVDERGASDKNEKDAQDTRSESERLNQREMQTEHTNSTNSINTVSTPVSTARPSFDNVVPSPPVNTARPSVSTANAFEEHLFECFSPFKNAFTLPPVPNVSSMDNTGIFGNAYDDVEYKVDMINVDTSYTAFDAPFTKFLKDHPQEQVIGSLKTPV